MDLSTRWLGLALPHPFIVGASPLVNDLDMVRKLEDAGAAAIVMHSLFEEQIQGAVADREPQRRGTAPSTAGHVFFPLPEQFPLGPDDYLEQLRRIRDATRLPVIGSLNGTHLGDWLRYAQLIESAGASALELNLYLLPTDPGRTGASVESDAFALIRAVRAAVRIPIAAKLLPSFSSLPNFARGLEDAGADGLVLFNRLYQPDFDIETPDFVAKTQLSEPSELLLRLHWTALLSGRLRVPLAVSGGVHDPSGATKALLAGAAAVQLVSVLLRKGPKALTGIRDGVARWCDQHGYANLAGLRAGFDFARCPDPEALARGSYLRMLQTWRKGAY
jgi:dihydroorotate dehydrogenase (fumarate)